MEMIGKRMGDDWLVRSIGLDGVLVTVQLGMRHDSLLSRFQVHAAIRRVDVRSLEKRQ